MIEKHEAGCLKAKAMNPVELREILAQWSDGYPVKVNLQAATATLDYKAVCGIWMAHLAKCFTERGRETTKAEMHDILCHKFLGYTPERIIGKTTIKPALRTITYPEELTRPEFYWFMREIEIWASEAGVQLPVHDSQYTDDKAKEQAA